ncbi:MAG: hypothetical protein NZ921_02410 [Candidatus Caldarchaeum sp.]|nr:hypothetical protein [Candidatus Caldarchaeum sp.]
MVSKGIFLKGVDRKLYRKLKALAAEKETHVYVLLNEAIESFLASSREEPPLVTEETVNNQVYRKICSDPSMHGLWVGIADGKVVKASQKLEKVLESMKEKHAVEKFKHGIVARVGETIEEREWLAGSLQNL